MTNLEKLKEIIKETFGCDGNLSDIIHLARIIGIENKQLSCQGFRCPYLDADQVVSGQCKVVDCKYQHFWELEYDVVKNYPLKQIYKKLIEQEDGE
jgi:hypothetical protein